MNIQPILLHENRHIHDNLICPISQTVLRDPVYVQGYIFSHEMIAGWLEIRRTNPLTRAHCTTDDIHEVTAEFAALYVEYLTRRAELIALGWPDR